MLELIKRKKLENLVLNIIVMVISITTIIITSDSTKQLFLEENNINSKETLESISNSKKYVSIDLTNAKLTRFSLSDIDTEEIKANTYIATFDDDMIMVFLKPNTAITDKVKAKVVEPIREQLEIQSQLERENKSIIELCFSNIEYSSFEKFYQILYISLTIIIILSTICSIFDLIYYIYPNKTYRYKKYLKKQQKAIYK